MSGWPIFGDYRISGTVLVGTAAIVVVALIGSVFINRALRRLSLGLQPHLRLPTETLVSLARMLSSLLWLCAGLLVLELWGISVAGLWAVLASAAAVVGVGFLAVWTIISNITASLFIGIWHPFRLGESVEILPEGLGGRVIDRNLMFTVLRETSGATLQIPNNLFFQKMFRVWATDEQYLFEFLEKGRPSGVPSESSPAPEPQPAAFAEKMPGA